MDPTGPRWGRGTGRGGDSDPRDQGCEDGLQRCWSRGFPPVPAGVGYLDTCPRGPGAAVWVCTARPREPRGGPGSLGSGSAHWERLSGGGDAERSLGGGVEIGWESGGAEGWRRTGPAWLEEPQVQGRKV